MMGYAPREYVGLLHKNGLEWTMVRRLIVKGLVTWTHMRARPAFTMELTSTGSGSEKMASDVDINACMEIARMIEHTYCVADDISAAILNC